ncbi:MAG: DUF1858 domain-containing protein [Patescibacteria group bacterium]|jgi:hybrid cluster-associated redox disulfide protein|nr:DUF1858 domain-containing protein [Patescibacteria group bacterium]
MTQKINKNTTLAQVLTKPESVGILAKYKVPCISCPMAQMEMQVLKLGDICKMYDLDLDNLLKDLNKLK